MIHLNSIKILPMFFFLRQFFKTINYKLSIIITYVVLRVLITLALSIFSFKTRKLSPCVVVLIKGLSV